MSSRVRRRSKSPDRLINFSRRKQTPDPTSQPVGTSGPVVTMATKNTSSKFKDIISKSDRIHSGSPVVYQVRPKKEKIGTLRRMTLGEKDPNKTNRTILLVGETGVGKSTLVNTLVNYTMGVKWEDDVGFKIVEEEKKRQAESQTSDVIVYQIFGFEGKTLPYSLTIIDTPGYGSTGGIEQDDFISQRLSDLFKSDDGVNEINAVGLVLKASESRLSDRQMYIFDSVMSLFGKNMEKNIVALITYSDGRTPKNAIEALEAANIKCATNEKNQPLYFLFDNCQHDDRTEDTKYLQHSDEITTQGMSQFTNFVEKTEPEMLKTTLEVLNERVRLTACIQNLKERIEFIELKQREIQQTKEALNKHEEEMKNNENVTVEVDEVYKETKRIDSGQRGVFWLFYEGAVCCTVCEENCHYPGCTKAWSPSSCEVMTDGRCTSCTGKCLAEKHVKENWIFVEKTRKVKKTLKDLEKDCIPESTAKEVQDLKEKFEKNKSGFKEKTSLLGNLQKDLENLEADKVKWLEEAYQHVVKLEQIALNVDSLSTYVHLDFLIEKMKEKGDTEKVQKLEEMACRGSEGVKSVAKNMYGQLCGMFRWVKKNTRGSEV